MIKATCLDSAGTYGNLTVGEKYFVNPQEDPSEYKVYSVLNGEFVGRYLGVYQQLRFDVGLDELKPEAEYTGGSSSYYDLEFDGVTICCNDVIEKLQMNYAEGNAFKAIWRSCAYRNLGKMKAGAKADGLYDAEKVEFFGKRMVEQAKLRK